MSESTLSLSFGQIYAIIGDYLGVGRTVPCADAESDAQIVDCIASGLRMFYSPPPVGKEAAGHQWTFLNLVTSFTTVAGQNAYTMTDDFAQLSDDPTYPAPVTGTLNPPAVATRIGQLTDAEMRQSQAANPSKGAPLYCSQRAIATDGTVGQRFELVLHPVPDAAYVITVPYVTQPNTISSAKPFPLGGGMHAETILQACLAVAEQRYDDEVSKHHQERFLQLLEQSIRLDREFQRDSDGSAWPLDPTSQGPCVTYRQFLMRVGNYFRFKWDPAQWTHDELMRTDAAVQEGYRRFCFPPPTAKGEGPHAWSFLQPVGQLTTAAGQSSYTLPENFGGLLGEPTYSNPAVGPNPGKLPTKAAVIMDVQIRQALASNQTQGAPLYCAVRPVLQDGSSKQRWLLTLYPIPDAPYQLNYQFLTQPPKLSLTSPFPAGGELHAETLLEAMLASAEAQDADEPADGKPAKPAAQSHYNLFLAMLAQSIRIDKQHMATTADSPWPVYPANRSIGLHYRELLSQAGDFMEFGWDPSTYSDEEFHFADNIVNEGYSKFLWPKPMDPKVHVVYQWSFLRPEIRFTTISGQADYPMPAYFQSLDGDLIFSTPNVGFCPVRQVSLAMIRRMQGNIQTAGLPSVFCVTPCEPEPDGKVVQAYKLTLYPTPDNAYGMSGRVVAVPPRLSYDNPFPMGGPQHAETIRTGVLMAAELRHIQVKPPQPFGRGRRVWIPRPQQDEFNERLMASIGLDAKLKPDSLGGSGEGRRRIGAYGGYHDIWNAQVTYQGNQF